MSERIRVQDLATKAEYTTAAHLFNPEGHKRLSRPAVDMRGKDIPTKYPTTIAAAVTEKQEKEKP